MEFCVLQLLNVHKLLSLQSLSILHCGAGLQPAMARLMHWPLLVLQMSCVHVLPSLQSLATLHGGPQPAIGVAMQLPVEAWQVSVVHEAPSSHTLAVPLHAPAVQTSPLVHSELSLQVAVLLTCWQVPLVHASLSLHKAPGWQPLPQFWIGANWQAPPPPPAATQASVVHALPSLHTTAMPVQTPFLQLSCVVQPVLSLQLPVLSATDAHLPVLASQASVVQARPSSQTVDLPATHLAAAHRSPVVHKLPSSHVAPSSWVVLQLPTAQVSAVQALPSLQSASVLHRAPQPAIGANTHLPLALSQVCA